MQSTTGKLPAGKVRGVQSTVGNILAGKVPAGNVWVGKTLQANYWRAFSQQAKYMACKVQVGNIWAGKVPAGNIWVGKLVHVQLDWRATDQRIRWIFQIKYFGLKVQREAIFCRFSSVLLRES